MPWDDIKKGTKKSNEKKKKVQRKGECRYEALD